MSQLITVPTFCQSTSLDHDLFFQRCYPNIDDEENLQTMWIEMQKDCIASYDKICTTVFTENPPFACTYDSGPSFLSVFANAFAGTEFIYVLFTTLVMLALTIYPILKNCCGCGSNEEEDKIAGGSKVYPHPGVAPNNFNQVRRQMEEHHADMVIPMGQHLEEF